MGSGLGADAGSLVRAGVSVRGRVAASEKDVPGERLEEFIVGWPRREAEARRQGDNEGEGAAIEGQIRTKGLIGPVDLGGCTLARQFPPR